MIGYYCNRIETELKYLNFEEINQSSTTSVKKMPL